MKYDFDKIIDRSGSGDLKHEVLKARYGRDDLIPLWVADMDFETPSFILDAIKNRLHHPIVGYTVEPSDYWPTVSKWIADHHGWNVEPQWMTYVPGVVKGIGMAINAFTQPGDKILIQTPVYHPFRMTIEGNARQVVLNPLTESAEGSFYKMDLDLLEKALNGCKMMILCNPHNPGGIQWDKTTLEHVAQICHKLGVIVISDEIHADLALFGHKHIPFATVSKEAEEISITFQAPTKTFNMAGIVSSYAIVPNAKLRQRLFHWIEANELNEPHIFAPIATIAAFKYGEEWRLQMLDYIEQNILFTEDFFREHIPGIRVIRPESSFLVWLDCRPLGLNHDDLQDLFVNKARLALNDGEIFDTALNPYATPLHQKECVARGFMRLNVGTPRSILKQALEQLAEAVRL